MRLCNQPCASMSRAARQIRYSDRHCNYSTPQQRVIWQFAIPFKDVSTITHLPTYLPTLHIRTIYSQCSKIVPQNLLLAILICFTNSNEQRYITQRGIGKAPLRASRAISRKEKVCYLNPQTKIAVYPSPPTRLRGCR